MKALSTSWEKNYHARRAAQYIIDCLWELDKLPTLNQLHQMFYEILRNKGFRAHQAKQIYKYALSIVKSTKKNNGKKPVLRKLSTRLDRYDARVDLENQLVIVKLRNRVFKIKLLHRRDYIKKFMDRKWYEVMISIDMHGRIWVCIPFHWMDLIKKVRKGIEVDGPAFIHALSTCDRGWRHDTALAIEISRRAVDTCYFPLREWTLKAGYLLTDRSLSIARNPKLKQPIERFLEVQGRFKHLLKPENKHLVKELQEWVDAVWEDLLNRASNAPR